MYRFRLFYLMALYCMPFALYTAQQTFALSMDCVNVIVAYAWERTDAKTVRSLVLVNKVFNTCIQHEIERYVKRWRPLFEKVMQFDRYILKVAEKHNAAMVEYSTGSSEKFNAEGAKTKSGLFFNGTSFQTPLGTFKLNEVLVEDYYSVGFRQRILSLLLGQLTVRFDNMATVLHKTYSGFSPGYLAEPLAAWSSDLQRGPSSNGYLTAAMHAVATQTSLLTKIPALTPELIQQYKGKEVILYSAKAFSFTEAIFAVYAIQQQEIEKPEYFSEQERPMHPFLAQRIWSRIITSDRIINPEKRKRGI